MFKRPPDYIIGPADGPYMRRWWLIPRNRLFNVYLHHIIMRDDDARALHDHPWWNVSLVLKGGYWEVMPSRRIDRRKLAILFQFDCTELGADAFQPPHRCKWRRPGSIVFRHALDAHRLQLQEVCIADPILGDIKRKKWISIASWSLFITGPERRKWGWWCKRGWVHWKQYVTPGGNQAGAGCGEEERA
jgi:hypothetical protein